MHIKTILNTVIAGAAVLSLAGCLGGGTAQNAAAGGGSTGGSTGGGSTGGGTSSQTAYDAKVLNYIFMVPTSQPVTGTASYTGEISVLTLENSNNPAEALIGDLNLNVNFGSGVTNPVSGTAGNFSGNVNGQATTVTGTLSTANALANDANGVNLTPTAAGTTTGLAAILRGTVSDPTGALSGDARMILGATLMGSGGSALSGGHQTTITPAGGGTSIATAGSLYADKN